MILVLLAFLLISLTGIDIFPHSWRNEVFGPYKFKAIPGVIIWTKAAMEALFPAIRPELVNENKKISVF